MADAAKGQKLLDAEREAKPRLVSPKRFTSEILRLWQDGFPSGDKTGWPDLDRHYTVMPGQFTVITGWPGSGKSEFLDAMLCALARQNWKFAIFSFENQPVSYHITKLIEKFSGMPFGAGPTPRVPESDLNEYIDMIDASFHFTETTSGAFSLADCLSAAEPFLNQYPDHSRGVVLDPWNELEHWRPPNMTEVEYLSLALSMVRNWARVNRVHVWIVAHPAKQRREEGKLPIPRPDMISGAAHWWNKADACLTVHRDQGDKHADTVDIHVQKVRFKHVGRTGMITLRYDRVTGRYSSIIQKPSIAEYYSHAENQ